MFRSLSVVCLLCFLGLGCGDDLAFKGLPPLPEGPANVQSVAGPRGPQGEPGVGERGPKGDPGTSPALGPWTITEVIDPCGDFSGGQDEVLFKFLNGQYLSYFRSGGNEFLALLDWGKSYVTTDAQSCPFKISSTGEYQE